MSEEVIRDGMRHIIATVVEVVLPEDCKYFASECEAVLWGAVEGPITNPRRKLLNIFLENNKNFHGDYSEFLGSFGVSLPRGFKYWYSGFRPAILEGWPALELFKMSSNRDQVNWNERWEQVGGSKHGGRMVALKDSPIWRRLSFIGLPFPPFDLIESVGTREIDREEAIQLGVLSQSHQVGGLEVSLDFKTPLSNRFNELQSVLFPEDEE